MPSASLDDPTRRTSLAGSSTQQQARVLRDLLEQLDDLIAARSEAVDRVQHSAAVDNIQPRIMQEAAGIERWVEVKAAMFEDTLQTELSKYEPFRDELETGREAQRILLSEITVCIHIRIKMKATPLNWIAQFRRRTLNSLKRGKKIQQLRNAR